MIALNRTSLSALDKAHLIEKMAPRQAKYSITALADEFSISRKSIYSVKSSIDQAIKNLLSNSININTQIQPSEKTCKPTLNRYIVALKMDGKASIRDITRLIPILFSGCYASFGYIQN